MKRINFQLYKGIGGFSRAAMIAAAGGVVLVCIAGDTTKATITDKDGATLSNPVSLTAGKAEFYVADSVDTVDLYILAPGGQFLVETGVPQGGHDFAVDITVRHQTMVIPFAIGDTTATTETDSGFDEPANALFLPNAAVRTTTLDATETIDVGTDSGASGNADGFIDGLTVATAALAKATLADGAATLGALLYVDESSGDLVPESHVSTAKSITYTLSAGTDTAEGFIYLPYVLMN